MAMMGKELIPRGQSLPESTRIKGNQPVDRAGALGYADGIGLG